MAHPVFSQPVSSPPSADSRVLTAHDLLKTLAIVLMVVDHLGYYFFPENEWFRVFGRMCVPIWFFLIGYANARRVQPDIWLGAGVLVVSNVLAGEYLLPLNILFTLAAARIWMDTVMARALRSHEAMAGVFLIMLFLALPSLAFFEYGTLGMLFAMFGYLRRHRESITLNPWALAGFAAGSVILYVFVQALLMESLTAAQFWTMLAGVSGVCVLLFLFRPHLFPVFSRRARIATLSLQWIGHHTLSIYVVHLLVFKLLAMVLSPERFSFLHFGLMPTGLAGLFLP